DAARERVRNAERLLTLDVKERFHGLLLAQKQVELAQKAVVLGQELVRIAEERFLAGDIAEIDVSLVRVEERRAQERVVAAQGVVIALRAGLAQILGLPPDVVLDVVDTPPGKKPVVVAAALAEQALRQRPDLNALMLEQEKNATAVELAKAERWPNVTVGIVYSREQSREGEGVLAERTSDDLLGLRLSLPLTTPSRRETLLREATARQSGGGRRVAALQAAVVREVEVATAKLTAAESVLNLYQDDILPGVEENLKTVHEAYRLGEIGILNVIEEQRRHLQVNNDYVVILRDRNIAIAQLEAATAGIELEQREGDHR
ncbi:MAG: TolC family protein, partial [Desulfuromonadales bacterium]|nr:TolC family protein [Desulfuromonadales bacterium]